MQSSIDWRTRHQGAIPEIQKALQRKEKSLTTFWLTWRRAKRGNQNC